MFDKIYNKVWKVTTIPALKRFNSRSQSEVKANLYNKVKKIFDNSNKELTIDNLEAIILKAVNSKVAETSDRTLEQRLRRIEEKVSLKKRVTEGKFTSDTDLVEIRIIRKEAERTYSKILDEIKRTNKYIQAGIEDLTTNNTSVNVMLQNLLYIQDSLESVINIHIK